MCESIHGSESMKQTLSIIEYNFDDFLNIYLDVSKMDDYYLNIIIRALETENNLRNLDINTPYGCRLETKKTVIYIDIIHICIGKLSDTELNNWINISYNEYNKRNNEKNLNEKSYNEYLDKITDYINRVDYTNSIESTHDRFQQKFGSY